MLVQKIIIQKFWSNEFCYCCEFRLRAKFKQVMYELVWVPFPWQNTDHRHTDIGHLNVEVVVALAPVGNQIRFRRIGKFGLGPG